MENIKSKKDLLSCNKQKNGRKRIIELSSFWLNMIFTRCHYNCIKWFSSSVQCDRTNGASTMNFSLYANPYDTIQPMIEMAMFCVAMSNKWKSMIQYTAGSAYAIYTNTFSYNIHVCMYAYWDNCVALVWVHQVIGSVKCAHTDTDSHHKLTRRKENHTIFDLILCVSVPCLLFKYTKSSNHFLRGVYS